VKCRWNGKVVGERGFLQDSGSGLTHSSMEAEQVS
jgi:hypothetical protein